MTSRLGIPLPSSKRKPKNSCRRRSKAKFLTTASVKFYLSTPGLQNSMACPRPTKPVSPPTHSVSLRRHARQIILVSTMDFFLPILAFIPAHLPNTQAYLTCLRNVFPSGLPLKSIALTIHVCNLYGSREHTYSCGHPCGDAPY